ncbi:hypothetical protein Scep_026662 [Stephania cephalantha]|uniref:Uncharacterized protein n=1 Tax=Stephania cephalantha TaxID=152367 RepID=A0AAP0ER75_9MAGN
MTQHPYYPTTRQELKEVKTKALLVEIEPMLFLQLYRPMLDTRLPCLNEPQHSAFSIAKEIREPPK